MKKISLFVLLVAGLLVFTACTYDKGEEKYEGRDGNGAPVTENLTPETTVPNPEVPQAQVAPASTLTDGSYRVDVAASRLAWKGGMVVGKSHAGLAPITSGELKIENGALISGKFQVAVKDLTSDEKIEGLEKHLKGPDFFETDKYPTATLEIKQAKPAAEVNAYEATALLTLKGVTAPISFKAQFSEEANDIIGTANFNIDRTVWGVKYGSGKFFQDLGDKTMSDDINFQILLRAKK